MARLTIHGLLKIVWNLLIWVCSIVVHQVPSPDIVVVPGGRGTRHLIHDKPIIEWIRKVRHPCSWNLIIGTTIRQISLEEIVSKSTLLATRPSRLTPKKCINKSIWLATGGAPSMGTPRVPSGCQPNWFVYAFSWVRSPQRRVDLDTISSSVVWSQHSHPMASLTKLVTRGGVLGKSRLRLSRGWC